MIYPLTESSMLGPKSPGWGTITFFLMCCFTWKYIVGRWMLLGFSLTEMLMLVRNVATWDTMLIPFMVLLKAGDMESAWEMFDRMPKRISRFWAAVIAGYVHWKNPKEAVKLYLEMEDVRYMRSKEVTVFAVLASHCLCWFGHIDLGRRVHDHAINWTWVWKECQDMQHNHIHVTYMKCGSNDVASEVFNGIPDQLHTVVS